MEGIRYQHERDAVVPTPSRSPLEVIRTQLALPYPIRVLSRQQPSAVAARRSRLAIGGRLLWPSPPEAGDNAGS